MDAERPGDRGLGLCNPGCKPVPRTRLINQHRQVFSQQLRSTFLEKKFDSPVIAFPLSFLSIGLIAYAIAITKPQTDRGCIDASLTPRKTECPAHFAVIGQLQTVVVSVC